MGTAIAQVSVVVATTGVVNAMAGTLSALLAILWYGSQLYEMYRRHKLRKHNADKASPTGSD